MGDRNNHNRYSVTMTMNVLLKGRSQGSIFVANAIYLTHGIGCVLVYVSVQVV